MDHDHTKAEHLVHLFLPSVLAAPWFATICGPLVRVHFSSNMLFADAIVELLKEPGSGTAGT